MTLSRVVVTSIPSGYHHLGVGPFLAGLLRPNLAYHYILVSPLIQEAVDHILPLSFGGFAKNAESSRRFHAMHP